MDQEGLQNRMKHLLLLALIPFAQGLSCSRDPCKNGGSCVNNPSGTFSCRCLPGYMGELCQFVDPCIPERCQNGGTCSLKIFQASSPPAYTCVCPPGFTGEECQGVIGDPCFPSPCQHGGSCQLLTGNQYRCRCPVGWTGKNCQLRDFCQAHPCANGGTCLNTYPYIICQCRPGFEGHTCQHDINECFRNPSPCLNGGRCLNNIGSFRCLCPASSTGPLCQYRLGPCTPEVCLHGSTCQELGERYHGCVCPPGYTGQYCEVNPDDCIQHQCRNGGTCEDGVGSYSCHCPPGWTGWDCSSDIDECPLLLCQNGGTCHNTPGGFHCICSNGWAGETCTDNVDDCLLAACYPGSTCVDRVGSFLCECPPGRTGLLCHLHDACLSSPCHPNAHCDTDLRTGHAICVCQQGYAGPTCYQDIDECQMGANPCEHGGSCHNMPGSFACRCLNGYTGSRCESDLNECLSQPCHNGASCLDLLDRFQCLCPLGFEGPQCQLEVDGCASSPCRNGGQCQNSAGIFHCTCLQGFEGYQCERDTDQCHSAPCGYGSCINVPGSFKCICSSGYTGPQCTEMDDPCHHWQCLNGGSCQGTGSGVHCTCLAGWTGQDCGMEIDPCDSGPCHQGATCQSHRGTFHCICPSGYVGATCEEDMDECGSNPCLNSGSCLNSPGSFHCVCPEGYTGLNCQLTLDLCSPNPCRNGGQCIMKAFAPFCLCPHGWGGSRCQQKTTQKEDHCPDPSGGDDCQCLPGKKCPNGRICTETPNGYLCLCPPGTKGPNCDLDPCSLPTTHCYHGGTCLARPEGFSCLCPPGYVGDQCEGVVNPCFSQPCNPSGAHSCQSHAHNFQCLCLPGYTGILCESVMDSCQPNPCLNGGSCHAGPDSPLAFTCHCPQGYDGASCDLHAPPCGVLYCHNGGVCISHPSGPQCRCSGGFSGPDCRLPRCSSGSCPAPNTTMDCQQVAGDGRCDQACSFPETRWDGGDCSLGVLDPWERCPRRDPCRMTFRDGECHRHCDNEDCLFDGFDCTQRMQCNPLYERYCWDHFSDGYCDGGCDTALCGWDGGDCWSASMEGPALGLVILLPQEELQEFLRSLAVTLRGVLRLQRDLQGRERIYPYTGKEELGSSSNWTGAEEKATEKTIGCTIFLAVDGNRCSGLCPTSPKSALNFLGALAAKGALESLLPYTVVAAWIESATIVPHASGSHFPGPLVYCVMAGVVAVVLGIFLGVWRIRRPQRREQGLLWLPPGFAPRQGKKRRCRREPVGEDAIGLKPRKSGTEFVEDSDVCSSPHFDGPLNLEDIKDDPESISHQNQGQPRTKKQAQLNMLTSDQEKNSKLKTLKTQGSGVTKRKSSSSNTNLWLSKVCGLTPLMPLAHTDVSKVKESWTDSQEENSGETPLHLAARYSRADAARRLLASGANANARDQWGRTPLHSAVAADALGVFQILLRHRQTDLDASAHDGSTPLILATRLGVENMVEELVANRVDIGARDKRGKNALHWAAAVNNERAAFVLLRNGADKDAQDNRAQTPLFLAAQEGSYKVACLLLQHGAKQNILDHVGHLARDVAQERLHHDILSLLDSPHPCLTAGQLPPHRPRPHHHRSAPNPRKLSWQASNLRLPPVPENEIPLKVLPPSTLSTSLSEDAMGLPPE